MQYFSINGFLFIFMVLLLLQISFSQASMCIFPMISFIYSCYYDPRLKYLILISHCTPLHCNKFSFVFFDINQTVIFWYKKMRTFSYCFLCTKFRIIEVDLIVRFEFSWCLWIETNMQQNMVINFILTLINSTNSSNCGFILGRLWCLNG